MNVVNVPIDKLVVSEKNVRKTLSCDDDETSISDLAEDIKTNGLINPITVRLIDDGRYEVIAGQRRLLAIKHNMSEEVACNIVDVSDTKAETISLVENVQRNQMTTGDKVKAYTKLYELYANDIDRVVNSINISKPTLQKYIRISSLPSSILQRLDVKGTEKISLDVAVELSKLPKSVDRTEALEKITHLTNEQKVKSIKEFSHLNTDDIEFMREIKDIIVLEDNDIDIVEQYPPYVIDEEGRCLVIPEDLYEKVTIMVRKFNIESNSLDTYC